MAHGPRPFCPFLVWNPFNGNSMGVVWVVRLVLQKI